MITKKSIRQYLLIPFFAAVSILTANAQVTIGNLESAIGGALLQMKTVEDDKSDGGVNADRGIAFPRVSLTDLHNLYPMFLNDPTDQYSGPNQLYQKDKDKLDRSHIGLLVYNINEYKAAKLEKGIYYWDGEQWQQMEKTPGNAEITFDCNTTTGIVPEGTYIENKELTSANMLQIHAHVTAPGAYQFLASTDNGYYFSASGFFPITGDFTIYAQGQGLPLAEQEDVLKIMINHETYTCDQIKVNVLSAAADYHIICDDAEIHGVYWVGKPLNPVNHYIKIHVNVLTTGSYSITSNEVDGISFEGQGTFSATGVQEVILHGSGTPSSVLTKNIVFTSNSRGGQAMQCETKVHITIPKKRILDLGDDNHRLDTNYGIAKMFKNSANFGTEERSTFKIETPIMYPGSYQAVIDAEMIKNYIADNAAKTDNHRPVDIVIMSYGTNIGDGAGVKEALVDYVKKGGVFIMMNENMTTTSNLPFVKQLFNNPAIKLKSDVMAGETAFIQKMPDIDNELFNGPFGDIRGLYCGSDNGYDDAFEWLPAEDLEWSISTLNYNSDGTTTNNGSKDLIYMFKHKTLNFFWCGDGGYGAAGDGTRPNHHWWPVAMSGSPDYKPVPLNDYGNTNGTNRVTVHNGTFIANLIAWAIYQAEVNGINTK